MVLLLMLFVCRKCLKDSHPKNWGSFLLSFVLFQAITLVMCCNKYLQLVLLLACCTSLIIKEVDCAGLPLLAKVNQPTSFTWAEVTTITHDFVKVLGRGGYGLVYSGTLANGEHVAVKVNKENTRNSRDQFLNEVSSSAQ